MRLYAALVFGFLFGLMMPLSASAQVVVSEIAWMGTAASANDEWIELHNTSGSSVSLSGWTLTAADGTPAITLSGSIGAGEYKLLERTDDTTFPGITALLIFTGAIGNEGESLSLKQGSTTIQSLSFASGWPAGDATTRETMQLNGSSWITAPETAGSATTGSGGGGGDDEEEEEDDTTVTEDVSSDADEEAKLPVYSTRAFDAAVPDHAISGSPVFIRADALDYNRTNMWKGRYVWNMGNGEAREYHIGLNYEVGDGFWYTFDHAGSYDVSVKYYELPFEELPADLTKHFTIEVSAPTLTISKVYPDGGVEIKNISGSAVDLSGWKLRDSHFRDFVFPEDSSILAGRTMVVSARATKLSAAAGVTLLTPTGVFVSTTMKAAATSGGIQGSPQQKTITMPVVRADTGRVLGAATTTADDTKDREEGGTLVWVLAFIILMLIVVIAVLLLGKGEHKNEDEFADYELIDE